MRLQTRFGIICGYRRGSSSAVHKAQYTSTCHWLFFLSLPKKSSHSMPFSFDTRSNISWMPVSNKRSKG